MDSDCDDAGLGCSGLKFIRQNPTHPFDRTTNRLGAERPERIYRSSLLLPLHGLTGGSGDAIREVTSPMAVPHRVDAFQRFGA